MVERSATEPKPILPLLREKDRKRFWSKVDQRGADECWPWLCGTNEEGRGRFSLRRQTYPASRVAFALTFGEPGALVCHTCDNPNCCNPSHLWLGSNADNVHDAVAKGRWAGQNLTHCKNGHEFTPENVRLLSGGDGKRVCRTCDRERAQRYKAQRKAEKLHAPKPADYRLKKHCKRGHPIEGANILLGTHKGQVVRRCKFCRTASERRRWQ